MYQKTTTTEYLTGQIIWHPKTHHCALLSEGKRTVFSEIPEWLTHENTPPATEKVRVSVYGEKLNNVTPLTGSHIAKFVGFASKEGEVPTPTKKTLSFKDNTSEILAFTALFELQTDGWKGATVPVRLEYNRFKAEDFTGIAYVEGGSKPARLLIAFMIGLGFNESNTIKYSANMLPEIEKRGNKKTLFTLNFSKGWVAELDHIEDVSSVWEEADEVPWEDDEVEEAPETAPWDEVEEEVDETDPLDNIPY